MNQAIDTVVRKQRQPFDLVVYSGSATVALLVAARRSDVASICTVAGNIDNRTAIALHQVSPMPVSLAPVDMAQALAAIPQIHYVGDGDNVVPPDVAESYARKAEARRCIAVRVVPKATHVGGWAEFWPRAVSERPRYRQRPCLPLKIVQYRKLHLLRLSVEEIT